MVSIEAATKFLSHLGFSSDDATSLMLHFDNQMSRLMITSHQDLIQHGIAFHQRLHLLRAIRCFHMEKWSKSLMNHFRDDRYEFDRFEKEIFHLMKYHIWMIYTSWTLEYIEKFVRKTSNDGEDVRSLLEKLRHVKTSLVRLKETVRLIKRYLS